MFDLLHTYDSPLPSSALEHIDREATIDAVIHQGREWLVRYNASFWKARSVEPDVKLVPGDIVFVVGRQSLVLLIQPLPVR